MSFASNNFISHLYFQETYVYTIFLKYAVIACFYDREYMEGVEIHLQKLFCVDSKTLV